MTDAITTFVLVLTAFASLLLGSMIVRRRRTPLDLRPIEGFRRGHLAMDEAVESGRPPHFSLGASAIGQDTTIAALAAAGVIYYTIYRLSFARQMPLVTLSDPITLAVASDTLRRAYAARQNMESFRTGAIAWYPSGARSLAFAAGVASHASDLDVSNHILMGDFGVDMALIGEMTTRRDQRMIANSTTLEGQAVAFAMANTTIIGEELFVGSAYLDRDNAVHMGSLIALDTLRWLVIIFGILLGVLLNMVD